MDGFRNLNRLLAPLPHVHLQRLLGSRVKLWSSQGGRDGGLLPVSVKYFIVGWWHL